MTLHADKDDWGPWPSALWGKVPDEAGKVPKGGSY
jgi:hypothetical protein